MIDQVIQFWTATWRESRLLFSLEALGTIASIIASLAIATGSPEPNLWVVFGFYLVGSLTLQYTMWIRQNTWMFILMTWYTGMNLIGIWNLI